MAASVLLPALALSIFCFSLSAVGSPIVDIRSPIEDTLTTLVNKIDGIELKLESIDEKLTSLAVLPEMTDSINKTVHHHHQRSEGILRLREELGRDECSDGSHRCSEMAMCTDALINYTCTCNAGYTGDGYTCHDINECNSDAGMCGDDSLCSNTQGSYECSCKGGFEWIGDMCQDIDECNKGIHTCHARATCTNYKGHYGCECMRPFAGDGYSCDDIECESPSLFMEEYGCISIVQTLMSWDEAKDHCEVRQQRLLEDLDASHFVTLAKHFRPYMDLAPKAWIGFREGQWLTSRTPVDKKSFSIHEREIEWESGAFDMRPGNDFGLFDRERKYQLYALCQTF